VFDHACDNASRAYGARIRAEWVVGGRCYGLLRGASLTDSGYVGLSVHTVARICAAAHSGQVIVSGQTAADLVLAEGVTLLDLGSHRFVGLPRDEPLFQVVAEGLLADFPPLRILGNSP
jgi:class 3 adenylate cyclase